MGIEYGSYVRVIDGDGKVGVIIFLSGPYYVNGRRRQYATVSWPYDGKARDMELDVGDLEVVPEEAYYAS